MPACNDFSEISVLIPGYSIEDLPTDLPEDSASSLLNAAACAWHPRLIQRSTSIPLFRQAESLSGYPGRRIVLVPAPSESWMPHEWRSVLRDQGHLVIAGCTGREEWIAAIESALDEDEEAQKPAGENTDLAETTPPLPDDSLKPHFFSLGIVLLQTQLLSRRRHHFVDPDNLLLGREVRLAADAWGSGNAAETREHLARCFEHLRETRERFYPMNCFLLDICIPGDEEAPAAIIEVLQSSSRLNLFATGQDLASWVVQDPSLGQLIDRRSKDGMLCLLTGHDIESRISLGSMAATVSDIERCREIVTRITGSPPRHWSRRRFGLTASLPMLLNHFGFESALHVALDDGLYPDRERSQFDWQSPDGSIIAAASRIPLAIDSASGFLRFADRYNESMQDDTTAALFMARLPALKSPWLKDLQIAAEYAPVLGEFSTMDQLCYAAGGTRLVERHGHADYVSPFLIQSSVLKTESPVSGPAELRRLYQRLESLRTLLGIAALIKALEVGSDSEVAVLLREIEKSLASLESAHVDVLNTSDSRSQDLAKSAEAVSSRLEECENRLSSVVLNKVPSKEGDRRGVFVLNTLPFARFVKLDWPAHWRRPGQSSVIELAERMDSDECLLVKMPPGGFVWLTESGPDAPTVHPLLAPVKNEPALAEELTLRNRHFEVTMSDRTGGISSVAWHNQRGNRLSQQSCFRYEREQTLPDDGTGEVRKVSYALSRLVSHRVRKNGTVFASLETVTELCSPVDQSFIATVRQITSVDRVQPRLNVKLIFENVKTRVKGNPWLSYFGCRFAWDNEAAAISRAVMGQVAGFRSERFESPDYVEISDASHRAVIATHGNPYHRRSGPRMLDSILMVEGESTNEFQFTIDFDQPFPLRTATDVLTPVIVSETSGKIPSAMTSSWILGLSARSIELVRVDFLPATADRADELLLLLSETDGQDVSCVVKTARKPQSAFLVNADRTEKSSLEITDQGVVVWFGAFQIKSILLIL